MDGPRIIIHWLWWFRGGEEVDTLALNLSILQQVLMPRYAQTRHLGFFCGCWSPNAYQACGDSSCAVWGGEARPEGKIARPWLHGSTSTLLPILCSLGSKLSSSYSASPGFSGAEGWSLVTLLSANVVSVQGFFIFFVPLALLELYTCLWTSLRIILLNEYNERYSITKEIIILKYS